MFRCNIYKRLRVSKQSFTIISHDVLHGVKIHYFALVTSKNLGPRCELVGEICPHLGYYLRVTTHVVDFFKVRDIIWRPVAYKKKMYNLQVNALWKIGFSFIQGFLGSCSKRDTTLAGLSFYYLFFFFAKTYELKYNWYIEEYMNTKTPFNLVRFHLS